MIDDRFYFKVDDKNDIKSIYRLVADDAKKTVTELIWMNNRWQITEGLVRMISSGEFYLEPVTKETVQRFTPYVNVNEYQPS
jgi:hypothetical protein